MNVKLGNSNLWKLEDSTDLQERVLYKSHISLLSVRYWTDIIKYFSIALDKLLWNPAYTCLNIFKHDSYLFNKMVFIFTNFKKTFRNLTFFVKPV